MYKSRRGRIVELLGHGYTDKKIIRVIDQEFPPGSFSTSNSKALYGTKWDLGKTKNRTKNTKSKTEHGGLTTGSGNSQENLNIDHEHISKERKGCDRCLRIIEIGQPIYQCTATTPEGKPCFYIVCGDCYNPEKDETK